MIQEEIENIKRSISKIEKRQERIEKRMEEIEKPSSKKNILGIFFLVIGFLFIITLWGAIIGLPFLVFGILLMKKKRIRQKEKIEKEKKKPFYTEENIGIKLFTGIGVLALVLSVVLFLKYAIDSEIIGHLSRIVLGVILGALLVFIGDYFLKKERYIYWGSLVSSGGFAISYFSIFSSYYFQEYREVIGTNKELTIFLLGIVIFLSILFSFKKNSPAMAGAFFALGYITSFIVTEIDATLILYTLILSIGAVFVSSYKRWHIPAIIGVFFSYYAYIAWSLNNYLGFGISSLILLSFFFLFNIPSFFIYKVKPIILITALNSFLFASFYYQRIVEFHSNYRELFILSLFLLYALLFFIFRKLKAEKISFLMLYLSLFYLFLFVPIYFNQEWSVIIWSLKALISAFLFLKLKLLAIKNYTLSLSLIILAKAILYDIFHLNSFNVENFLESTRLISFLITAFSFYSIYFIFKKSGSFYNSKIPYLYSWTAFFLLLLIFFTEFFLKYTSVLSFLLILFSLSLFFISEGKRKDIFYQSLIAFFLLFLKIIFIDIYRLEDIIFGNILNSRIFVFSLSAGGLYLSNYYLEKWKEKIDKNQYLSRYLFSLTGTIILFLLILEEVEGLWLSVGWVTLALIVIILGLYLNKNYLRMWGIIIFIITILKVFLYDTKNLDTLYRNFSYLFLGLILLFVSFLYAKYREKIKENLL